TGCIYYRVAERRGYGVMKRKLLLRTLRLYGYHALLLALVFIIAVRIAAEGNRPGLANLLSYYFVAGAKHAIVDGALLIYRPSLGLVGVSHTELGQKLCRAGSYYRADPFDNALRRWTRS